MTSGMIARYSICSRHPNNLDVVRFDANSLHEEFGARFRLVESSNEIHQTPLAQRSSSCIVTAD
jgi:hypothetical protein